MPSSFMEAPEKKTANRKTQLGQTHHKPVPKSGNRRPGQRRAQRPLHQRPHVVGSRCHTSQAPDFQEVGKHRTVALERVQPSYLLKFEGFVTQKVENEWVIFCVATEKRHGDP